MDDAGIELLSVPEEYRGRRLAKNIVDTATGEVLAEYNTEITVALLAELREKGIGRSRRSTPMNMTAGRSSLTPSQPIAREAC